GGSSYAQKPIDAWISNRVERLARGGSITAPPRPNEASAVHTSPLNQHNASSAPQAPTDEFQLGEQYRSKLAMAEVTAHYQPSLNGGEENGISEQLRRNQSQSPAAQEKRMLESPERQHLPDTNMNLQNTAAMDYTAVGEVLQAHKRQRLNGPKPSQSSSELGIAKALNDCLAKENAELTRSLKEARQKLKEYKGLLEALLPHAQSGIFHDIREIEEGRGNVTEMDHLIRKAQEQLDDLFKASTENAS
ncbi:hypothetical protein CC80DRAFT_95599, partial [Byssothecium circinans]